MLALSWRKWPDPLVDFGRELYVPWRISEGAVWGRDVESIYGPLSAHVNALVFAVAGPGIMKLVAFNLAVYAGIVMAAHAALRRGWGRLGAWAGAAFFAALFSFVQLTARGNYNYATPYSHEAVHGLLALLGLVLVLQCWRRTGSAWAAGGAGLLVGLTAVLKVEHCVVACALSVLAAGLHWRAGRRPGWRALGLFAGGALLPTAAFAAYFWRQMAGGRAVELAAQAVLNAVGSSRYLTEKAQLAFIGLDEPGRHLREHLWATALAAGIVVAIVAGARLVAREHEARRGGKWRGRAMGAAVVAGAGLTGWLVATHEPGFALLGLTLAVAGMAAWDCEKARRAATGNAAAEARLLLAVAGTLVMLRMPLFGRVYHYGFYQAAIAGMAVAAALVAGWPRAAGGRVGRGWAAAAGLALLAGLTANQAILSAKVLDRRTLEVGRGADRMLHFPLGVEPTGEMVRMAYEFAERAVAPSETLLVLPEGIMINYLSRRATPLATTHFFADALADGREAELVRALERTPPDWVIVATRDLRENGIMRYGERPGRGELLLRWVVTHCEAVGTLGGDPLDPDQCGAYFYKRRAAAVGPDLGGR
jgi:hypothetical protein